MYVYEHELEALEARGRPLGLSALQVKTADTLGMPLASFAAYRTCRTVYDAAKIDRAERLAAEAAEEVKRQAAVARARADLG